MNLLSKLVAGAALSIGLAGAAQAMPVQPAPIGEGDPAITEASNRCIPRIRYTYRPGRGIIPIVVGWICFPLLAVPIRPLPGPGPDPAPFERIAPVLR